MALDAVGLSVETFIQYGAIGIILFYFLVVDYFERKRKNVREDAESKDRKERDKKAAEREEACVTAHNESRRYHTEVVVPLIKTANSIHKATLQFLRDKNLGPSLPDIPLADDETRIILKDKS